MLNCKHIFRRITYSINAHPVIALMFSQTGTDVLPRRDEGCDKPSATIEPLRIMVPTRTRTQAAGLKVRCRYHYTTAGHYVMLEGSMKDGKESSVRERERIAVNSMRNVCLRGRVHYYHRCLMPEQMMNQKKNKKASSRVAIVYFFTFNFCGILGSGCVWLDTSLDFV